MESTFPIDFDFTLVCFCCGSVAVGINLELLSFHYVDLGSLRFTDADMWGCLNIIDDRMTDQLIHVGTFPLCPRQIQHGRHLGPLFLNRTTQIIQGSKRLDNMAAAIINRVWNWQGAIFLGRNNPTIITKHHNANGRRAATLECSVLLCTTRNECEHRHGTDPAKNSIQISTQQVTY